MPANDINISTQVLDRFCVAGINYHKADTTIRGTFAISKEQFEKIADQAKAQHIRSVFVVSTCNRTEIYGFAESVMVLVNLLVEQTSGSMSSFLEHAYLKNGQDALNHLYNVASGLDSQILGDYEILGQIKQAVDHSTSLGLIGPIMNRTVNYAFQASKRIKTHTALSSGTVSVSYAAIELLRNHPGIESKKILVIGAGKFGSNVCRNLKQYLPTSSVTIINRTLANAIKLAETTGLQFADYAQLDEAIAASDVIIVCTNATEPSVLPTQFKAVEQKLVLDLSVPVNVHPDVRAIDWVDVIDVDQISATILDKTLARRHAELPKAREIILHYRTEFSTWLHEYRYSLHIKDWKDKLQELSELDPHCCEMAMKGHYLAAEKNVQKAVTRLAVNLRTNQEKGCQFINAINDYLQMS